MKNGGKTLDPLLISRAIVVWIGKGKSAWPHRDTERLVEEFGTDLAARLHPVVKALADEFFASDANWTIDNKQMADVTAEELQQRYPGLTDAAADALEKLKNEFFAPDAKWAVADIKQMADSAAEKFREHHPEITEEAIQALKWCYTFDNR